MCGQLLPNETRTNQSPQHGQVICLVGWVVHWHVDFEVGNTFVPNKGKERVLQLRA
jgi:hypothetical protein